MNSIPIKQNDPLQLERLAAQHRIYGDAKGLVGAQWLLATLPALCWAICLLFFPTLKVYATLTALMITFVDFGVLDPWIKRIRTLGARTQEAFDTDVLELGWNSLRSGKQPPPEIVQQYASRAGSPEAREAAFRDWYPVSVGELPIANARLLCQRTNCHWDATLRKRYATINNLGLSVIALVVIAVGLISDPTFTSIVLAIIAPISPIIVLLLRQGREYSAFALISERLREHIEVVWEKSLTENWSDQRLRNEAAAIQSEIFLRRASAPMVFDWLYRRLRKENEESAQAAARKFVDQAKRLLQV